MGRACSTNGGERNAYRALVGKAERKRPLGRPRPMWVDNIKMKNAIFWDIAPCRFSVNRLSKERIASIFRVEKSAS
jgi:hypothetical protein